MRPRGNPTDRRRGEAVRAVLLATVKPDAPLALDAVCQTLKLSRSSVLRHLARLQEARRVRGYTTANGVVRVW